VAARAGRALVGRRLRAFIDRIHAVMDALDTSPLPTVAVLHGVTFGGGLELALTADLRIAEKSARLAFPELRLGLIPGFGGLPRLEREVGGGVVRDLLFTGRTLGARRAQELGLVSQVVERGAGLDAARALAVHLASYAPSVTARAKAFTKALPKARLEAEKDLFCEMVTRPEVLAALDRFVTSTDARPYLP
jgi:enoyl-CoA hydratase/carnithine racemase